MADRVDDQLLSYAAIVSRCVRSTTHPSDHTSTTTTPSSVRPAPHVTSLDGILIQHSTSLRTYAPAFDAREDLQPLHVTAAAVDRQLFR